MASYPWALKNALLGGEIMDLLGLVKNKYRIISVVGMAKNAGKTVTLNGLIEESQGQNVTLGLTSTGRDGERLDIVTMTEKPVIYVPRGTLITTASEALANSQVKLEILEVTDFNTPMGKILIGRAVNGGLVELAGPETNGQIRHTAEKMLTYGAELVVVDGAIDRKTAAAPAVTEATILATGAVLSRNVNRVIKETLHQVELFKLKALEDPEIQSMAALLIKEKAYGVIDENGNVERIPITTALNGGIAIGAAIKANSRHVVLSGSLVKGTLEDILSVCQYYQQITLIVQDATKIFMEAKDWSLYRKKGVTIRVLEPIHVVAVTTNPYSPQGYFFNPEDFRDKMRVALSPLPVVDLMLEEDDCE